MAEVLVQFDTEIVAEHGGRYVPRACGRASQDGRWEGWIEFLPVDGGAPIRSARETVQPDRDATDYWAQGLTQVYLEGALARTLAGPPPTREREHPISPHFDAPAPAVASAPTGAARPHAVLDPYQVFLQGESVLLQELAALDAPHLRDIAIAYAFTETARAYLAGREELTAIIVAGVRRPLAQGQQRPEPNE